jgi:hypothetical protein
MSILENLIAIIILVMCILPISNTLNIVLKNYKEYQQEEELLILLENISIFLYNKNISKINDEITLIYDYDTQEYIYENERFSVLYLNQKEIKIQLETINIEKTELILGEILFEKFNKKTGSRIIIKRKFLMNGD